MHALADVKWYTDKATGADLKRPAFERLQKAIFKGEVSTVIVWKLDRLSRSLHDLLRIMRKLDDRKVGFRCLTEPIDTTTPALP